MDKYIAKVWIVLAENKACQRRFKASRRAVRSATASLSLGESWAPLGGAGRPALSMGLSMAVPASICGIKNEACWTHLSHLWSSHPPHHCHQLSLGLLAARAVVHRVLQTVWT